MGSAESSCCSNRPAVCIQTVVTDPVLPDKNQSVDNPDGFGCTEWSHVESLLAHLPPEVHAELEDKAFQKRCHQTFRDIVKKRKQGKGIKGPAYMEGDELIEAVQRSVPDRFLKDRLHITDLTKLLLAFDADDDGHISKAEFDLFCMWAVAMEVMGFFAGTTPFAKIASETAAEKLLIVSEFLDPDHILGRCALPDTVVAYYHPDGLTLDEFTAQLECAAHVRTKQRTFFKSVALANHGPTENGLWNVCSDSLVSLRSLDKAWPKLMPMFRALADMVADPGHLGHVDLLACNFAANQTGLDCLRMIESQVKARFAASTDATGNVALQGNWELERGGRNVAPIYFHEHMLADFTKLMQPGVRHIPYGKYDSGDKEVIQSAEEAMYVLTQDHDAREKKAAGLQRAGAKAKAAEIMTQAKRRQQGEEAEQTADWSSVKMLEKNHQRHSFAPAGSTSPRSSVKKGGVLESAGACSQRLASAKGKAKAKGKRRPPARYGNPEDDFV